jgi:hypothetical protein
MPYRPRYGIGVPYGYPGWPGWGNSYAGGYPDTSDNSEPAPDADYSAEGNETESFDQGQAAPPPYPNAYPYGYPYAPHPAATPANEEAVTLVFKDGRPREQVHNFVLTANTLTDLDHHYRNIPLDQIDVAETVKLNREAGVEFYVPGSTSPKTVQ